MSPTRIFLYGVTGSGKTTLARRLSEATGIPWHSVDDLTWEPGWNEVTLEIQAARIQKICGEESWILDTAYNKWSGIPLARVQLIVFLDYPRWLSFARLCRRCIERIVDRKPICNGNRETFSNTFLSRNSILCWHFRSFSTKRARVANWEGMRNGPAVIRLRSPKAAEAWLASVRAAGSDSPGTHERHS